MRLTPQLAARTAAVLALAAVLAGAVAPAQARPADGARDERPNILVVMTDDMTAADLKLMPHTQRLLVDRGTKFADAIDSYPLCCPARATFLTGQYAHNHGVEGNFAPDGWYGMEDRGNILPAWLQRAGYRTAMVGKWLNGYGARDVHGEVPRGFDIWRGLLDVSAYDYFNYVMNRDGRLRSWGDGDFARKLVEFASIQVDDQPDSLASIYARLREVFGPGPYSYWGTEDAADYSPDVTGRMTARLVRAEARRTEPFFIWWSPASPHREDVSTTLMDRPGPDPRPPPRYARRSSRYELPRPPSFNEPDISDKSHNLRSTAPPLTEAQIAQLELDYQGRIGSLLAVDDHVRRLVRTLRRTGQLDETVIVFLSDNGWLQGEHRIPGDKFLPFDESLRVPFVVRGPGVPENRVVRGQVSNIDFAPTLLDLADATEAAGRRLDGVSLVPAIRDPRRLPDRVLEIEALAPLFRGAIPVNGWDRPYTGVRTDRYTYVVWSETGEHELYDRRTDPYELDNRAGDPAYATVERTLSRKLARLVSCGGRACNVAP